MIKFIGRYHKENRQRYEFIDEIDGNFDENTVGKYTPILELSKEELVSRITYLHDYITELEHDYLRVKKEKEVYLKEVQNLNKAVWRKGERNATDSMYFDDILDILAERFNVSSGNSYTLVETDQD